MKYFYFNLLIFIPLLSTIILNAQSRIDPWEKLPDEINGWRSINEDRIYHEDDLFDYIDGGAELFLSFGFNQVFNRIYSQADQPDIYVDVFEMTSAFNAYGVFTLSTEKPGREFGQGSQYTQGSILFWKNKYFVSIITNPETPEAKETIFKIAQLLDESIPNVGALPGILDYLPQEHMENGSIRYFRHHHWQNSHLYIAYENIFNIDQTTHCILAKYKLGKSKPILLLIEYPDEYSALRGYNKFVDDFLPNLKGKASIIRNDNTWTGAKITGNILAVVFKARNESDVGILVNSIQNYNK
ncbi:DUF6599 family protein [Bacteroidota bacterium]